VVALYDGLHPDERTVQEEDDDKHSNISYVTITKVDEANSTYHFENADTADVVFIPDTLPVAKTAIEDVGDHTIKVAKKDMDYSGAQYSEMGLSADSIVQADDFLAFYEGEFGSSGTQITGYGRITAVDEENGAYIIAYADTTKEEMEDAMSLFDSDEVDGDTLLDGVDEGAVVQSIQRQVEESGFAREVGYQTALLALETDTVKKAAADAGVDLDQCQLVDEDGNPLFDDAEDTNDKTREWHKQYSTTWKYHVDVNLYKQAPHLGKGIGAALTVSVTIRIPLDQIGYECLQIEMSSTLQQEMKLDLVTKGKAEWSYALGFIPYISDYKVKLNANIQDYTDITFDIAALNTKDDDIVSTQTIDEEMKELLNSRNGKDLTDRLVERYRALIHEKKQWHNLFSANICNPSMTVALLFNLYLDVDFVMDGYMNLALGADFTYQCANQYSYDISLFGRKAENHAHNLSREKIDFEFYVLGKMGIRAGLKMEFGVALICKELAKVSIDIQGGPYIELTGFFACSLEQNKSSETGQQPLTDYSCDYWGGINLEAGAYLEITFEAEAFAGIASSSMTLYEKEWPLWSYSTDSAVIVMDIGWKGMPDKITLKGRANNIFDLKEQALGVLTIGLGGSHGDTGMMYPQWMPLDDMVSVSCTGDFFYDTQLGEKRAMAGMASLLRGYANGQLILTFVPPKEDSPYAKFKPCSNKPVTHVIDLEWTA